MSIIYTPKGRAREYSPLAANLYEGCSHGCLYCYAPGIRRVSLETYSARCAPRRDVLDLLKIDCAKFRGSREQVLLSFIGDPYCASEPDYHITRGALQMFLEHQIPVAILSKGGRRVLEDVELFKRFGQSIKVGATLTMYDPDRSREWEPGAALPRERVDTLAELKRCGIRTWASFEPVIDPEEFIRMILESLEAVDEYRIGKLNHYRGLDAGIDWSKYLALAVDILRDNGKPFYVKQDLRESAPAVRLYGSEVLMDDRQAYPFRRDFKFDISSDKG